MGRGLYHQTGIGRNDMVLHQDHRGRWRIDLVTSTGGNHIDVTGPNRGYDSAEAAFSAALDEQSRRGLRGKSHVYMQQGDEYMSYEPHGQQEPNPRKGKLLPSQRNEPSVRRDVLTDFMSCPHIDGTHTPEAFFEHDAWWVQCKCGAQWSVVDVAPVGFDFEQVSEGDESYHSGSDDEWDSHMRNGSSRYRLQRIKTCANCGHHKSVHRYDPSKPGSGPQYCDVPGCRCAVFRQPAERERVSRHVPEGDEGSNYETNGPRTGILSDGTRVNVYHQPGTLDEYTVVPHSLEWDQQARGEMRSMLGLSATGRGFSQWTEGMEGRHLGRKVAWAEVPEELKRHIEHRVVGEANMVANARGRSRPKKAKPETREERIRHQWDEAEAAGLVRLRDDPEQENYFDVYGEPDDPQERAELEEAIERHGVWYIYSQYLSQDTGSWETADGIGMIFGNDVGDDNPYIIDLKESALRNIYGGHERNPPRSTVDEHAKRELELYIENEYALIGDPRSMGKAIDTNLRKKVAKGTYDPQKAPQAWQHLIDEGAKRYAKAFSSSERDATQIFNAATRRAVAADFARAWEAENLGR